MSEMRNVKLGCTFVVRLPFERIKQSAISYDHHGLNESPRINLRTRERGYRSECLRPPADHL